MFTLVLHAQQLVALSLEALHYELYGLQVVFA